MDGKEEGEKKKVGGGERAKRTTAIGRGRHGATNLRWYNIKPWPSGVGASVGFGAPGLHLVVLHGRVDIQHPSTLLFSLSLSPLSCCTHLLYSSRWVAAGGKQRVVVPITSHQPSHTHHTVNTFLAAACAGLASGSVAVLMVVEPAALVPQCCRLSSYFPPSPKKHAKFQNLNSLLIEHES